jgi:hypothetical protein
LEYCLKVSFFKKKRKKKKEKKIIGRIFKNGIQIFLGGWNVVQISAYYMSSTSLHERHERERERERERES